MTPSADFAANLRSAIAGHAEPQAYSDLTVESAAEWGTTPGPGEAPAPRTYARPAKATQSGGKPATEKQFVFLRSLLAERAGVEAAEAVRAAMNVQLASGSFGSREASAAISALLEIPKAPTKAPEAGKPASGRNPSVEVPAGRYAIEGDDGVLRFYTVDRPDQGKWAGYTFVKVHASDDRYAVKGAAGRAVLAKIAEDPEAASLRYGRETNHCGRCGKELTDAASRAAGIGPICSSKGW